MLRQHEDIANKGKTLMPWNLDEVPWILLVVDLPTQTFHYLDSKQQVSVTNSLTTRKALTITCYMMREKYNYTVTKVTSLLCHFTSIPTRRIVTRFDSSKLQKVSEWLKANR